MNIKIYVSAVAMKLYLIPLLVAFYSLQVAPDRVFFSSYSAQGGVFDCSTIDFTKEKPVDLKVSGSIECWKKIRLLLDQITMILNGIIS
jgi:hypothetical protein